MELFPFFAELETLLSAEGPMGDVGRAAIRMFSSRIVDTTVRPLETPLGKDKLLLEAFHGEDVLGEMLVFRLDCLSVAETLSDTAMPGRGLSITRRSSRRAASSASRSRVPSVEPPSTSMYSSSPS